MGEPTDVQTQNLMQNLQDAVKLKGKTQKSSDAITFVEVGTDIFVIIVCLPY